MTQEKTVATPLSAAPDRHASQDGSILVSMTGVLLLLVALLGSIQMGYAFYVKRELQKAADLAALSGVQMFVDGTECAAAMRRAEDIINLNVPTFADVVLDPQPTCGNWKEDEQTGTLEFDPTGPPYKALRVSLNKEAALLPFGGQWLVRDVEAVAAISEPVAAFSVGSRLLSLKSDGLVGKLLQGAGVDVGSLNVLDSKGLATARITPNGLLEKLELIGAVDLGAGTPEELLGLSPVSIAQLIEASALVLGTSNDPVVKAAALDLLNLTVNLTPTELAVPIPLFGNKGIFAIADLTKGSAALNALVDVSSVIAAGVAVASGESFVDLSLEGFSGALTVSAHIVAPPTIAIGRDTTAKNAQVNLDVKVNVKSILGPLGSLSDNLRIILGLAQSEAKLIDLCSNPAVPTEARFDVETKLVSLCLAPSGSADNYVCGNPIDDSSKSFSLLGLSLLPLGVDLLGGLVSSIDSGVLLWDPPESTATITLPQDGSQVDLTALGNVGSIVVATLLENIGKHNLTSNEQTSLAKGVWERNNGLKNSLEAVKKDTVKLQNWLDHNLGVLGVVSGGLVSVLGGVVGGLTGLVSGLVSAILDLVSILLGCWKDCQIGKLSKTLFDNHAVTGLLTIVFGILQPVLESLSTMLNSLFQGLGMSLAETDLTLHSVQCGGPRLVE